MRYFLIIMCSLPFIVIGQTKTKYEEPMLGGSKDGVHTYIAKQLRYPDFAREKGISGRAVFKFKIDTTGKIDSLTSLFSTHPSLESEAARVIKLTDGKWKPALKNGIPVSAWHFMPLAFMLDGNVETARGNRIAKGDEYYNEGLAKYNNGSDMEAIIALRAAFTIDPENTGALLNVALIYINTREYDMACFYLNKLKELKKLDKDTKKEVDNMLDSYCKD